MSAQLAHIADRVLNRPLMILPDKLALIASVLDGRIGIDAAGLKPDAEIKPEASQYVGNFAPVDPTKPNGARKPYRTTDAGVAIIPVLGSLVNRGGWLDAMSGITSYEKLKFQISSAASDADVRSIILDMDSPGGEAIGAFEVADAVRDAAAKKPIVAVVNGMAASAAYAIASAATKIVTTKSGLSGSIGVVMLHLDHSRRIEREGIVPTLIHAGKRKIDGTPYKPLTDEVKDVLQDEINRFQTLFVSTVAEGRRNLSAEAILAMEAAVYIGADAVAAGLADAVGTFESALSDLSVKAQVLAPPASRQFLESRYSQVDLDRARAEGRAAAMEESVTDGGIAAAQKRIAAILALPEAQGKQKSAQHLAMNGHFTIDAARQMLLTIPPDPDERRAGSAPYGLVFH